MFSRYRHYSLFKQLLIPMLVVGVIGVGAVLLSALALQASVKALGEMYDTGSERLQALQEVDKNLAIYRAISLRQQASENAATMRSLAAEMQAKQAEIEQRLPAIYANESRDHGAAAQEAEAMHDCMADYFQAVAEAVRLSADFEKESAFEVLTRAESQHLTAVQASIQQLTRQAFDDIAISRVQLLSAAQRNLLITLGISLMGGLVLFGMAFYVSQRASLRITELLAWSKRIAAGDLGSALVADSHDEIGQLTAAMGGMVGNLAQTQAALEAAKVGAEKTAEDLRIYANAFDSSGESILITDRHNRIVNVNAAFTAQTGYRLDEVLGRDPKLLSSGGTSAEVYKAMWRCLETDGFWQGELWDRKKTGEVYPKWSSISVIRDTGQAAMFYIASFSDISERKASEQRIDYLAHHDALTGLINRYNLENRLSQSLLVAQRDGLGVAVMFIDMDRFKTINDTLGHHIGDQLLIEVARRLRECVRESDMVARLGGDEFVVVLCGLSAGDDAILVASAAEILATVAPVAEKILRRLGQPYPLEQHTLHSTPSIGVAIYPDDGSDGQTLMRNADTAMYHAKERGRNNVQYFTATMNDAACERLTLENDLRQAVATGQMTLHYQPQIRGTDGVCCGVEALARWQHPERGAISPEKFIRIAEESGLIETLGEWVLDEACRQLRVWREAGIGQIRMAVNLSARQLRLPDFVASVARILERHALCGNDLELEITESVAMENPERAIGQLQALRDLGIVLAIDDFGTGYSSLAYLKRLPIQVLKLDRSFVRDIETDESDAAISAATLALAHSLGLKVVAEGVETAAQRDFLIAHQCDCLQGYWYSRPVPAGQALQFIKGTTC